MNKRDAAKAVRMLGDRVESCDVVEIPGGGVAVAVTLQGGGKRVFTSFDAVVAYCEERAAAKRGRPPTDRGRFNYIPPRQLGRVPDAEWEELKGAAAAAGEPFTAWALRILLDAARKGSK